MTNRRFCLPLLLLFAFAVFTMSSNFATARDFWQPAPGLRWQIQFSGKIVIDNESDVFDVDGFDTPTATVDDIHSKGAKAICYISAGSWEKWRPDADDYPEAVKGKGLDGWPGERWLDIRRIDVLGPILTKRIEMCHDKGFDAVEFDNVDGYQNKTGFPLSGADQLAFNRFLAQTTHDAGLSVGLKNDLGQVKALEPDFDFAINEQCFDYKECKRLTPFAKAGKGVLVIEYKPSLEKFCPTTDALGLDGIRKKRKLDAHIERCLDR